MRLLFLAALVLAPPLAATAETDHAETVSLGEAIRGGEPILSLRFRYEDVTDDGVGSEHARASTLRSVLGFRSLPWRGLSFYLEGEDVSALGSDSYNNAGAGNLNNGIRDRPVVADPDDTEINQAYLRLERGGVAATVGRQEIVLGDSRFVGNVGWRQNHQSFDAFRLEAPELGRLTLRYAFVDQAKRIDGGAHEMASHLLQGEVKLGGRALLTLYGLYLDYDDPAQWSLSSSTFGAEVKGSSEWGGRELLYELECARQADAADNPGRIDAAYYHLMAGAVLSAITVKLGFEVLEGSPDDGQFNTPLATLHKFNGWADKFLSTPVSGLEDAYLQLLGKVGPVAWTVIFHDLSAETGGADYGQELDLELLYTAPWKQGFGLKGALYDAESHAADTDKWMLWTAFAI